MEPSYTHVNVFVFLLLGFVLQIQAAGQIFEHPQTVSFTIIGYRRANVIPCSVTRPSAHVSLVKVSSGEEINTNGDITYDPSVGFTLLFPNVYFNGEFKCIAKLGSRTEERSYILVFLGATNPNPPRPQVMVEDSQLRVGSRLHLTCRTLIPPNTFLTMNWMKDGMPITSDERVAVSKPRKRMQMHSELSKGYSYAAVTRDLTIPCLIEGDSGEYRCVILDHNRYGSSRSIDITVVEGIDDTETNRCD